MGTTVAAVEFSASRADTYTFAMINPVTGQTVYVKVKVSARS